MAHASRDTARGYSWVSVTFMVFGLPRDSRSRSFWFVVRGPWGWSYRITAPLPTSCARIGSIIGLLHSEILGRVSSWWSSPGVGLVSLLVHLLG